jgi:parallel beta-helix repeat protein
MLLLGACIGFSTTTTRTPTSTQAATTPLTTTTTQKATTAETTATPEIANPPGNGDWVVNTTQILENKSVVLNGNLVVNTGATLILSNTQLTLNNAEDGQYGIRIKFGAGITITKSKILAARDTGHFSFVVERNVKLIMQDSELNGCGWGEPYQGWVQDTHGLTIYANNAILERNLFTNCFVGVQLKGGDTFNIEISANKFIANIWSGIEAEHAVNSHIVNNIFNDSIEGISIGDSDNNFITGNEFSHHHEGAIFLFHCQNNEISNNHAEIDSPDHRNWTSVYLAKHTCNNHILNNTIIGGQWGMTVEYSSNNIIQGNIISKSDNGIYLGYADGNVLLSNTTTDIDINTTMGNSYGTIVLYQSSNNQILNNHVNSLAKEPCLVVFGSSKNNSIMSNIVNSNSIDLLVNNKSDDNNIIYNTFATTQGKPIIVSGSSNNNMYGNNFKGTQPSYDDGDNHWDDGKNGNYWTIYSGTSHFSIQPSGTDNFPKSVEFSVIDTPIKPLPAIKPIDISAYPVPQTITDNKNMKDTTWAINGTLTIGNNASLTLTNVTLSMCGSWQGKSVITVNPGGALYIDTCKIVPTESGGGYLIVAQPGSKIIIKNSTIRGAGNGISADWGGIIIETDHADIEDNLIIDSEVGLTFFSTTNQNNQGQIVIGNTIDGCYNGILFFNQSNSVIKNNVINNFIGFGMNYGGDEIAKTRNITIIDNTITGDWCPGD